MNNQLRYYNSHKPKRLTISQRARLDRRLIVLTLHALYLKQQIDHTIKESQK